MKRREFIAALGGAAALPLVARAQERVRHVTVVIGSGDDADDLDMKSRFAAFAQALQQLGWMDGSNVQINYRFASGKPENIRKHVDEIVAVAPDAVVIGGAAVVPSMLQATRTVPIVFTNVIDPIGAGYVESMAKPGGNATGFVMLEYSMTAKWLELLKEIAPRITRAVVLRDPTMAGGVGQFGAIATAAPTLQIEVTPVNLNVASTMERSIATFAQTANGSLIATASALTIIHRDLIVRLAARHKLPSVFHRRLFVANGGLMSYGPDVLDQFRKAAGYVDRILKGEKPADLPVQAPTKYELVINLKTAKALGLAVPPSLLARADEVIE